MSSMPQTASFRPEWTKVPLRIDPAFSDLRQQFEAKDGEEFVAYKVDRRGAVIRRCLQGSGLPIAIALPPSAFSGVAARAMEDGEGQVTVTLELHHRDPKLCVPLLVASDLYDVAADWRGWSELFSLPMLMIEADGSVAPLEETLGKVRASQPLGRRRGGSQKGRRPRFLARRKPGGLGVRMIVAGEEIIARH